MGCLPPQRLVEGYFNIYHKSEARYSQNAASFGLKGPALLALTKINLISGIIIFWSVLGITTMPADTNRNEMRTTADCSRKLSLYPLSLSLSL